MPSIKVTARRRGHGRGRRPSRRTLLQRECSVTDTPREPAPPQRAWSWRSRDVPVPYGILPFCGKDHSIKPWDQTPSLVKLQIDLAYCVVSAITIGFRPICSYRAAIG